MRILHIVAVLALASCSPDPAEPGTEPPGPPTSSTPETEPEPGTALAEASAHDAGQGAGTVDDTGVDAPPAIDDGQSRLVLKINEVMADNRQLDPDETGMPPDWIELYSLADEDLALDGYRISDDPDDPDKHVLSGGLVLPAGGHLVLWADGQSDLGADHLGFSVSDEGEQLSVYTPQGGLLDRVEVPPQARDLALQRLPDGSSSWRYTYLATPGAPNVVASGQITRELSSGSSWRYLDGGIVPLASWTSAGFDDSAWPVGTAPLGYGDAHQVTTLSYGVDPADKVRTYYFRTEVDIVDVGELWSASVGYMRDDGLVLYLNGTEIARDNMPAGAVDSTTLASSAIANAAETAWTTVALDPALLVEGRNVFAAELHQATPDSSDLGFDLFVEVERPAIADEPGSGGARVEAGAPSLSPVVSELTVEHSVSPSSVPTAYPPELPVPLEAHIFDDLVVHKIAFEVDSASYAALQADSRTYQPATFVTHDAEFQVAIRVKGNVTWRPIDEKPSLKLQFDYYDEERQYWGLSAVNLHNMSYDPSFLAESTAYWVYREAGLPAPRTSYVEVTINGEYRGLYAYIESKNQRFLEHWLDDPSGSVYEAGSFNWGCDVNDTAPAGARCDCFEHDHVGDGDTVDDLTLMCEEATIPDAVVWHDAMRNRLDWDGFLGTITTDMAIAHWDSYGYNLNNWHMLHEPATGQWWWTPWSTDLAFGWNPWGSGWCDQTGVDPSDYDRYGYLVQRCMGMTACADELDEAMRRTADHLDALDLAGRIAAANEIASAYAPLEPYPWYSTANQASHASCIADFMADRSVQMRVWAGVP